MADAGWQNLDELGSTHHSRDDQISYACVYHHRSDTLPLWMPDELQPSTNGNFQWPPCSIKRCCGAANLMQLLILHRLNGWQSNETECTNKALPKWQNQKPHHLHTDPHQFPVGGWNLSKPVHWGSESFQVRINKWTSRQNSKPPLNIVLHSGWWYTYPSEKWWSSSVGIMTFPILRKNNPNVPNHQPVIINHY